MPMLKSSAGDMKIALSAIEVKEGEFCRVGKMGNYAANIAFPKAEFHAMLWLCVRPRVIIYVLRVLAAQGAGNVSAGAKWLSVRLIPKSKEV
jgi:hypothetical protein